MTVRRDFLAFTAGAIAARTVLPLAAKAEVRHGAAPSKHPDAQLLDACRAFSYACAGLARINAMDDPTDEMTRPIVDAWAAPLDTIIHTPATTMAGVRAKAQAVIGFFETGGVDRDLGETVEKAADYHELMAWRLCLEILAMGAEA